MDNRTEGEIIACSTGLRWWSGGSFIGEFGELFENDFAGLHGDKGREESTDANSSQQLGREIGVEVEQAVILSLLELRQRNDAWGGGSRRRCAF